MSNNSNKNPIDINRLVYDINNFMATEATLKKVALSNDAISNSLNGQLNTRNLDYTTDSITVVSNNLDTRLLTTDDEITIPSLDACITGTMINVNIAGGELVIQADSNIHASNGDILTATAGSLNTNITNLSSLTLSSTTSSITIPALTSVKDSVTVSGNVGLVSGSSVSVSNQITGYSTSALQTTGNNLLTDIKNKTINKTTDSIDITNQNINVNPRIENSNYDLLINGATLWADTTPVLNPFFADPNGREGWYYDNLSNIANKSNIYWYANPTAGNLQENDMTFSQLSNMYSIFTCDYVDNGELTVPFLGVYSQPTGTNDFIPTFAHSRWVYQLSNTNLSKLRKGETILVYTGSTRPTVYNELPSYQLNLVSQNGDCSPSEIIAYMTVNTQATTSKIGYLLQFCGYYNSAVGYNKQYGFQNSKNRVIQNNLYAGLATENTLVDIEYKTNLLSFYNESGINELMTYDRASETNLIEIKNNTDGLRYSDILGITGSSSLNTFDLTNYQKISGIETYTSKLNNLTYTDNNLNVKISNPSEGITHVFIDNFPASQTINGSVTIDNFPAGITHVFIDNFPASQTINGSVSVDNFPAGITHVFIDNFPASQTINGSVSVSNFPAVQGITGSVSVSNFPAGITHVFIDNFPASQTINGSVSVDNFPAGITHVFIDNFPASQTINGSVSVSNFPASQTVNGTVTVNTISGFAVESGGNLASIKSNTDKLNSVTFTGGNLNTNISNTVTVTNGTNPLGISGSISNTGFKVLDSNGIAIGGSSTALYTTLRDTSGSAIGVSGNPLSVSLPSGSGFDGKAYLYSGNGTTPITQTTISTKSGIDTYLINTSVDTHCYGSSNGTNWHHLKTDGNGILNIHSMTQDGAGIDITSTLNGVSKQSLDVNVSNISAIPISGTVGISGTVPVSGTVGISGTVPVSGTVGISGTVPVSGSVSATVGNLNSVTNTVQAGIVGKTFLDCMSDIKAINSLGGGNNTLITCSLVESQKTGNTVNQYTAALDTNSFISAYNPTSGNIKILSMTESGNTRALDVNDASGNTLLTTANTTLSAISSKMVTQSNSVSGGATVGLNVYNIYTNKLIYRMAGSASATVSSQFLGPEALAFDGTTFNIGLNYPSSFNIYLTSAGTRSVDIDYIDANGNRAQTTISINNTDQVKLTNAVNINNMNWTPTSGNADTRLRAIARTAVYRNQLSTFLSGAGVITVPNGYVGIVSNLYFYAANGDDLIMVVKDKYNNVKTTRYMAGAVGTAVSRYFPIGDINEPLIAGDSVYFLSGISSSGQKYLHAIVTMEPL